MRSAQHNGQALPNSPVWPEREPEQRPRANFSQVDHLSDAIPVPVQPDCLFQALTAVVVLPPRGHQRHERAGERAELGGLMREGRPLAGGCAQRQGPRSTPWVLTVVSRKENRFLSGNGAEEGRLPAGVVSAETPASGAGIASPHQRAQSGRRARPAAQAASHRKCRHARVHPVSGRVGRRPAVLLTEPGRRPGRVLPGSRPTAIMARHERFYGRSQRTLLD